MMWTLLGLSSLLYVARANCDASDASNLCTRKWEFVQSFPTQIILAGTNTWNGLFQSKLEFAIALNNAGMQVVVDYKFKSGIPDPKLSYTFKMAGLLEFYSPDDSAFDPQDQVIQEYSLRNASNWGPWVISNTTIREGIELYQFTSTTKDGVFQIRGRTTSAVLYNYPAEGDTSHPNFIKFDYLMNGFPYNGTDTSLAMVACLSSELNPEGVITDHSQITVNPVTPSYLVGDLNWDIFVSTQPGNHTDNIVTTYGATPHANMCELGEKTIYYSVTTNQRLDSFVWDPYLGVLALPPTPDTPTAGPKGGGEDWAIAITVIVLGLVLFMWWRRQHNKSEYGQMAEPADPMATY